MKLVFVAVNARFSHSNPAVYSIYYYLKEQLPAALFEKLEIVIKTFHINQVEEEVTASLFAEKADLYAFSVYIWNAAFIDRIIARLHGMLPDALLAAGGAEVDYDADYEYRRQPLWSYVCTGEGEREYLRLAKALAESREAPAELLRQFREAQKAGKALSKADSLINELPFYYPDIIEKFDHRIVYYESSRGCPFQCSYCVSCLEPAPVFRALDKVFRELEWFIEHDVKLVKFLDRSFNFPPERARAIWSFLIERCRLLPAGKRPCFHFELEASLLDDASVELLKQAPEGLFQFEIGIQSIHPETLWNVRRKALRPEDFGRLKALIDAGRQHIHIDLISALPGESAEAFAASYNYCWSLWADMLQTGHLKLLRGTPMKREAVKRGYRFNPYPPYEVLASDAMSAEEIITADQVADMTDRYYNRRLLPQLLPLLPGLFEQSPYAFMASLAESFYAQRGETLRSISQAEHYIFVKRFLEARLDRARAEQYVKVLAEDYERVSKPGSLSWSKIVQKHEL